MKSAAIPKDEAQRLEALRSTGLLDTRPEQLFDDFTRLAAAISDAPIALISLVDAERQWFKSRFGLEATETPREQAFCAHAILDSEPLVVPDSRLDERFADNPLVTGDPGVRFYAGVPLRTSEGHALGTLCIIDREPRELQPEELDLLRVLARQVAAQIELRRLAGELTRANQELQRFQRLQDDFVASISHDLRSPLSSVVGFAELLESDDLEMDERREFLRRISQGANHTLNLASNLIDAGKLAGEEPHPEKRPTSLAELIREVGQRLEGAALLEEVQLEVSAPDALPTLLIDAEMIDRCITNLGSNAIRHSPRGAAIELAVRVDEAHLEVSLLDRGPGVPIDERDRLFTRYGQLSGAAAGGCGLGLYIVRRLIEAHRGEVGYEDAPGGGARFFFRLPLV